MPAPYSYGAAFFGAWRQVGLRKINAYSPKAKSTIWRNLGKGGNITIWPEVQENTGKKGWKVNGN
jgi:hypothetical protein